MSDREKTVFISYRREASQYAARAIFMDLRAHGYDVFMDVENIDSGTFSTVILNQIEARAHFLLLLAPGTLDRIKDEDDWLRTEIERAIELDRNIVPVLVNGFEFEEGLPYFTGSLEPLAGYNALTVPDDYFEQAMHRLRSRFLRRPVYAPVVDTPDEDRAIVAQKIEKVVAQREKSSLWHRLSALLNRAPLWAKSLAGLAVLSAILVPLILSALGGGTPTPVALKTPEPTSTALVSTNTPKPTATQTSIPTITQYPNSPPANASLGDTWTRPKDNAEMVYVPAGEFEMGTSESQFQVVVNQCVDDGSDRDECKEGYSDENPSTQ